LAVSVSVMATLRDLRDVRLLADSVELRRRQLVTQQLTDAVDNPTGALGAVHSLVKTNLWLLAGHYLSSADHSSSDYFDRHDLLLHRTDDVLQLVQLKKRDVPDLVYRQNGGLVIGDAIHRAVGQATNKLRSIAGDRASVGDRPPSRIRIEATVFIGREASAAPGVAPREIRETIGMYDSDHHRVNVRTYDDLLRTANKSIEALSPNRPSHPLRLMTNASSQRTNVAR
jgi:hypothetical protein